VAITDPGRRAFEKLRDVKLRRTIEALQRLTEEERGQFMALLTKMTT